jgi:hypothetical protein
VLNKLRIQLRAAVKKFFTPREAQPKFINPYAMTEATTPQFYVQPKFKNGKFILEKEESKRGTPQGENSKKESIRSEKGSDKGITKSLIEVVIEDIEGIAGETKKRSKQQAVDKDAYNHFLELTKDKK